MVQVVDLLELVWRDRWEGGTRITSLYGCDGRVGHTVGELPLGENAPQRFQRAGPLWPASEGVPLAWPGREVQRR